ncbi:MAG: aldolase/citrate lyase family protein [Acetanaerobacterium sp.]
MNKLENQMVSILSRMRDEFYLEGVKGEFEAEGARLEELLRLKEIATKAGVGMTVKIGGCEAITDMRMARSVGATEIVAPMIESAFAAQKYLKAAKMVFSESELEELGLFINVETVDGVRNFDAICSLADGNALAGLDIGRVDMSGSMGLPPAESSGTQVFDACLSICKKWKATFPKKKCIIGGFLNLDTIRFLEQLPAEFEVGSESKKVIFGSGAVREGKLRAAFSSAIEFESLWYQNCMSEYQQLSGKNWSYFEALPNYQAQLAK